MHVLLFPYILATAGLQPVGLNITNEDIRNALVLAEETVRHRFEYFQPQIYQAGRVLYAFIQFNHVIQ